MEMYCVDLRLKKIVLAMMCVFTSLVFAQSLNKTFFNLLQTPYMYIFDSQKDTNIDFLQGLLQTERNKNLNLSKQLKICSECHSALKALSNTYRHVAMGLLIFSSQSDVKFVIIKTNCNDVKINDIAIDKNNYLIGRVVDILGNGMYKIQLINDKKAYVPSVILGANLLGYINGSDYGFCDIVFDVDGDFDMSTIHDGDVVVTSGFNDFIPFGINIGTISIRNDKLCVHSYTDRHTNVLNIVRANK